MRAPPESFALLRVRGKIHQYDIALMSLIAGDGNVGSGGFLGNNRLRTTHMAVCSFHPNQPGQDAYEELIANSI